MEKWLKRWDKKEGEGNKEEEIGMWRKLFQIKLPVG